MAQCIVKQVLRGTTTTAGASVAVTLSPAVADITKCIIFFSVKNDRSSVYDYATRANFDSVSQITFYRAGNTDTLSISWEVVEFTATSGILVQHGSAALTAASTSIVLGTAVNTATSWIMLSWTRANTALNQTCFIKAKLTGGGANIQLDAYANPATCTCNYQVIQYDGCSVQTLELTNQNAQNATQAISTVDTTKTALFTSCAASLSQTYDETMIFRVTLDDATHVRYQKYGGAGNGFDITTFVVSFTDSTLVDTYSATFATTDSSISTTVTSRDRGVSVNHTKFCAARFLGDSDSATNNATYAMFYSEMTSNTNVTVSRAGTGANSVVPFCVIAFLTTSTTWTGEPRTTGRGVMRGVGRGIM